jgi:hypothetical protein
MDRNPDAGKRRRGKRMRRERERERRIRNPGGKRIRKARKPEATVPDRTAFKMMSK